MSSASGRQETLLMRVESLGVMDPAALVRPAADLAALAAEINAEHRRFEATLSESLLHARAAGERLIQAKAQLPHGQWLPWVEANCAFSERTARRYMAVAERWEEVEANRPRVADLALRDADRLLSRPRGGQGKEAPAPGPVVIVGDRWRVERADCIDWLNAQPEGSIDLIFGSPPYEDARLYLEDGDDPGIARGTEEWVAWMVRVHEAARRACKGLVAFVVEGRTEDYRWSAGPALLMAELHRQGFCLRKPPAYRRVGIPGSGGPDWLRNDYEFIICATKGGRLPWSDNTAMGQPPKYQPGGDPSHRRQDGGRVNEAGYATMEDRNNLGPHRARQRAGRTYVPPERANPGNVIDCVVGGGAMGSSLCHENEAPFPEPLAESFVRSFCPVGGVVADPFCGSGTTLAVAVRWGRVARGCDVRQSQVELTSRRLSGETPAMIA